MILNTHKSMNTRGDCNKNLDLLHYFKIEINRLITGENFMSKLRRLVAFIGCGESEGKGGASV
jgi:hypothetical protein